MANVKNFRVIIVGGSIAGLTLAHSLQRCGIDFVVLEANDHIAPQVGASIGILANGARILDQLGIFDDVLEETVVAKTMHYWSGTAKHLTTEPLQIFEDRHGYPIAFLDRQIVLRILYSRLGEHQCRVHINKKVVRVENLPNKAVVHCKDGSTFEGDLVVGADGVRSIVREEMWRYMESLGLTKDVATEKANMKAEYSCLFGISNPTVGVNPGEAHRTFAKGYSTLTIGGKGGRIYWFLFAKMDRPFTGSDVPRFNEQDLGEHVAKYLHIPITPTVPFSKVYEKVEVKAYLCLEEALYQYWSMDRCVCIGDSIHKMTPNIGQGGNSAIETAASLANCLSCLVKLSGGHGPIALQSINDALQEWKKARQPRAKEILTLANEATRFESGATIMHTIISQYLLPYLSRYLTYRSSQMFVEGEILDFLPVPARAIQGTMPHVRPSGQTETALIRIVKLALTCVPLVGLIAYAIIAMGLFEKGFPIALPILQKGSWTARNGEMLRVAEHIHNVSVLVKLIGSFIAFFLPSLGNSQPASYWQMRSLLTDLGIVCVIWLLERYRKTHTWAEVMLSIARSGLWLDLRSHSVFASGGVSRTSLFLQEYQLPVTNFADSVAIFLKYDATIAMTSGLVWLGMKSSELKDFERLVSWWKVIGRFAQTTAILGSGAMALSWAWREEIMAKIAKTQSHSKEV
ncbi:hypothetical protein ANOM_000766 [Aspergillus nomiae NRRL 13137]|uniref:FAD-binding domain-containing protein n=1 Tax=Aspergillus nomiae NRRL (strain ATCC 15546 / NRRL 13137 / CBS 260.88 / M93) TaxID=1509407 RepID=A0A0L1JH57_ASPN3|nr:uncharacterized protein ANOM_000766 [Aspergillus nomiae NRRL 13137]KNG91099.1 hypothetical protein ANOM_000766 [Aspergillus nomiae NRRL 13137]